MHLLSQYYMSGLPRTCHHTHTHVHAPTCSHSHIHTCTRPQIYTYTHTHSPHTHIHMCNSAMTMLLNAPPWICKHLLGIWTQAWNCWVIIHFIIIYPKSARLSSRVTKASHILTSLPSLVIIQLSNFSNLIMCKTSLLKQKQLLNTETELCLLFVHLMCNSL